MNPTSRRFFCGVCIAVCSCLAFISAHGAGPPNDAFADAIEIVTAPDGIQEISLAGTTVGATVESGEDANAELAASNERGTIWWKWTCPTPGYIELLVYSTNASLAAGAFTGTTVSNLTTVQEPMSDIFYNPDGTFEGGAGLSMRRLPGRPIFFR